MKRNTAPMPFDLALSIWNLLVEKAGVKDDSKEEIYGSMKSSFLHYFIHEQHYSTDKVDDGFREFRFMGSLGFGGKLHGYHGPPQVSCYSEDSTPERVVLITQLNKDLEDLWNNYYNS